MARGAVATRRFPGDTIVNTAVFVLMLAALASPPRAQPRATLRMTQPHLVAECVGTTTVAPKTRRWTPRDTPMTLTFTMRNEPRPGVPTSAAGHATVTFTPERGHRYEVEVRADASTFSRRVWPQGDWVPVVRDRTTDRIVSEPPVWGPPPCVAASGQR